MGGVSYLRPNLLVLLAIVALVLADAISEVEEEVTTMTKVVSDTILDWPEYIVSRKGCKDSGLCGKNKYAVVKTCKPFEECIKIGFCGKDSDCCSGKCRTKDGWRTCEPFKECIKIGFCGKDGDCCSGKCRTKNGWRTCEPFEECLKDGFCGKDGDCCSGKCRTKDGWRTCEPLKECIKAGICEKDSDCCSGKCR